MIAKNFLTVIAVVQLLVMVCLADPLTKVETNKKIDDYIEKVCKHFGSKKVELFGSKLIFYRDPNILTTSLLGSAGIIGLGSAAGAAYWIKNKWADSGFGILNRDNLAYLGVSLFSLYIGLSYGPGALGQACLSAYKGALKSGQGFIFDEKGLSSEGTMLLEWNALGSIQEIREETSKEPSHIRFIDTYGKEVARIQKTDTRQALPFDAFILVVKAYWTKYGRHWIVN